MFISIALTLHPPFDKLRASGCRDGLGVELAEGMFEQRLEI